MKGDAGIFDTMDLDANSSSRNKWVEDFTVAKISPETDAIRAIANAAVKLYADEPYPFFSRTRLTGHYEQNA